MRRRERQAIEKKIRSEITVKALKTIRQQFCELATSIIHKPVFEREQITHLAEFANWARGYRDGGGQGILVEHVLALAAAMDQIRIFLVDYDNLQRGAKS